MFRRSLFYLMMFTHTTQFPTIQSLKILFILGYREISPTWLKTPGVVEKSPGVIVDYYYKVESKFQEWCQTVEKSGKICSVGCWSDWGLESTKK